MTGQERGFLLLCAELATPEKPLTLPQVNRLRAAVRASDRPQPADRHLTAEDLRRLGYDAAMAARIVGLLNREAELDAYLEAGAYHGIHVLTLRSGAYPRRLTARLGADAPPLLFYRGDVCLLEKPSVSLVGSRELGEQGRAFARRVGFLAAQEGYVLISGNAAGADREAQQACLASGGSVISVLADSLADHVPAPRQLLVCEEGWHLPFTAQRALGRNRVIHALGDKRFVAQTANGYGGSWQGATDALRRGLPVYVCDDGSEGAQALAMRGAQLLQPETLHELCTLLPSQLQLFP